MARKWASQVKNYPNAANSSATLSAKVIFSDPYTEMLLIQRLLDDPGVPPVLICKIRKGQELKIKCIVKKVLSNVCNHLNDALIVFYRA